MQKISATTNNHDLTPFSGLNSLASQRRLRYLLTHTNVCCNITKATACTSKLEALRQHKPPPNTARHKSVCNFLSNPENPDFGLWTPGSEAWSGSPPKLYHLVLEPCPTPTKNFVKIRSQTDRQTDRTKNITSFFGGGKYHLNNTTTTTILRLSGLCPGQPGAGTRRNIHPLTPIVVINHLLFASSIFYDLRHPPCSIYVPDSLFPQSVSKFSLVYLLAWHLPLHTPCISLPNHCLLFAAHAHTIATCFAVVLKLCHPILVSLSQPFTWNSIL